MNTIVCNSSPIIALSHIDCLTLFPSLFEKVYIPEVVLNEISVKKDRMVLPLNHEVFERYEVKDYATVEKLYGKLHYGEIEVVIAAKELGLQNVILDDLAARKLAETFLLQPVGTLGLLLLAKEKNALSEVKPYLDQLLKKNFRMSKVLYEQILRFADEY